MPAPTSPPTSPAAVRGPAVSPEVDPVLENIHVAAGGLISDRVKALPPHHRVVDRLWIVTWRGCSFRSATRLGRRRHNVVEGSAVSVCESGRRSMFDYDTMIDA